MTIIPPINPIFYLFLFLAFLLFALTLIILLRSKRARWRKALFFGGACYPQIVAIVYPISLYSNKPAPLVSPLLLIGRGQNSQIVALNARDGSVRWTQSPRENLMSATGGPGNVFYVASQTDDGESVLTANAASSGSHVWQTSLLSKQTDGKFQHLIASNDFVYVDEAVGMSDEVVYALRVSDGSLAWKHAEHLPDLGYSLNPPLSLLETAWFSCRRRIGASPHCMQTMARWPGIFPPIPHQGVLSSPINWCWPDRMSMISSPSLATRMSYFLLSRKGTEPPCGKNTRKGRIPTPMGLLV